ncbi:Hypothetical Protein FCC1311_021152 [Hondaea fermentalgiana]|uniref:Mitochondrial import inner membrane translocase subunit TIM22 n=1 Tax=Hondaea fermentalgiana TaxID=2315210 RepID=A0A2R5G4E8_9STRA|nr:Hypothetical Protein FCC1311_021152 [Hondaea fermentalgiana]|eukprot:GBG25896.1 Hypothetical Protein FCC1311_021152 [Hondaea fermentalgiana]
MAPLAAAEVGGDSVRRFSGQVDDSRYRPSCSARAADGFIRGGLVGLAWGAAFHPLDELAVTGWTTPSAAYKAAQTAEEAAANVAEAGVSPNKPRVLKDVSAKPTPQQGAQATSTASKLRGAAAQGPLAPAFEFWQTKAFPRLRSMGQASLMFGCFLGTFGGMTCVAESFTEVRHHYLNVFVGGATAGGLLAVRQGTPRVVMLTALGTGTLTAALHSFVRL